MIIDHTEMLELSDAEVVSRGNELGSLRYLSRGLEFLNQNISAIEVDVLSRLDPRDEVFMGGNHPELKGVLQDLIACAFHWYAVTACNYARLVGWLANGGDSHGAIEYVKRVLPQTYVWRNQVGAHFSITDPRDRDTPADLAKSVMFPLTFDEDAFFAGSMTLTMGSSSGSSTTRMDMRWSLTQTHTHLAARYWPEDRNR